MFVGIELISVLCPETRFEVHFSSKVIYFLINCLGINFPVFLIHLKTAIGFLGKLY